MYSTAMRVELVKKRVREKQRQQRRRSICRLAAMCVVLSVILVGVTGTVSGPELPVVQGMFGTILLHEDTGGYVLVGIISFTAAVIITVLCIRYRERHEKDRDEK